MDGTATALTPASSAAQAARSSTIGSTLGSLFSVGSAAALVWSTTERATQRKKVDAGSDKAADGRREVEMDEEAPTPAKGAVGSPEPKTKSAGLFAPSARRPAESARKDSDSDSGSSSGEELGPRYAAVRRRVRSNDEDSFARRSKPKKKSIMSR